MGLNDLVWATAILAAVAYLLHRSFRGKGGACVGCSAGGCAVRGRPGATRGCATGVATSVRGSER